MERVSAARPRAHVMASSGSDATRRHVVQPSTSNANDPHGRRRRADAVDSCSAASDRTGLGAPARLAEGDMFWIVRCRLEAGQRTDDVGDIGNGEGRLTPTTYRDRAESIRRMTCFGSSRTRKTPSGPPLGSCPACPAACSRGRHSRQVPEVEPCRAALRDCRSSLWRTIASRWIDRVS